MSTLESAIEPSPSRERRFEWLAPAAIQLAGAGVCVAAAVLIAQYTTLSCLRKAILVEALVAAWCGMWTYLVLRKAPPSVYWTVARVFSLGLTAALIFVISSTRPIDIRSQHLVRGGPTVRDEVTLELVRKELDKANQEIQLRIGQEDTWFHYKFLLLGALLAAFGGAFTFGARQNRAMDLASTMRSPAMCIFLALACIVAVAIDIHLRNNIIVVQQLGLWIRHYAEPALTGTAGSGFKPWEQFLRMPGAGMHSDNLYGFLFYPHLHFMTWVVFALYLCCFHAIALDRAATKRQVPDAFLPGSFAGVHLAFCMFAWVGHFVPGIFETNVIPFAQCWHTGARAAVVYLGLAILLGFANLPFFWTMAGRRK